MSELFIFFGIFFFYSLLNYSIATSIVHPNSPYFEELLLHLHNRRNIKEKSALHQFIVNPFSQLFICDHHYGYSDLPGFGMVINLVVLKKSRLHKLQPFEIICCESSDVAFHEFADSILPYIKVPFILMTGSSKSGEVTISNYSRAVKANKYVAHWFSHDPIFETKFGMNGYSGFPYGVVDAGLEDYADVLLQKIPKSITLQKLPLADSYPDRKILNMSRKNSFSMPFSEYYRVLAASEFVLSPKGDRPECYRHWESIGLGTIPISDLNKDLYGHLFHESMIFLANTTCMLKYLLNGTMNSDVYDLHGRYRQPHRALVTSAFWTDHVYHVIKLLTKGNESDIKSIVPLKGEFIETWSDGKRYAASKSEPGDKRDKYAGKLARTLLKWLQLDDSN